MRCDGFVIATPAGSTGYNLANGGPVLAWGVEGFVVSFIAPHTLTARALVVAPRDVLTVRNDSREEAVEVSIDGRPELRARAGRARRRLLRAVAGPARAAARDDLLPPPAREVRAPRGVAPCNKSAQDAVVRARSVSCGWYTGRVLLELRVENLLLIERAELRLGPGLNVLTGETGAGKTVLAHALDLLLGGRARPGIVRPGRRRGLRRGRLRAARRAARGARRPPRAGRRGAWSWHGG